VCVCVCVYLFILKYIDTSLLITLFVFSYSYIKEEKKRLKRMIRMCNRMSTHSFYKYDIYSFFIIDIGRLEDIDVHQAM
jgi:hypothetical protein